MRIANAVMCALFGFGALLQLNDPDPLRWVAIYGAAAATCGWLASTRRRNALMGLLPALVAAVALTWAANIAYGSSGRVEFMRLFEAWGMKNAAVEERRELYGLLIVGTWMIVASLDYVGAAFRRAQTQYDR
jgi:hypothetical protein